MSAPKSTQIPFDALEMPFDGGLEDGAAHAAHPVPMARAILGRYVAELFTEPGDDWRTRLTAPAARVEAEAALDVLRLERTLIRTIEFALPATDELLDERSRLFGHTARSACPTHELEYGRNEVFQQSQSLADIAGFYAAFGFQAAGPFAERPDHAVAEWEFLSLLALKEAMAAASRESAGGGICRDAQRAFLRDHLATWMPAFLARIRKSEPRGFFTHVAKLADALLRRWCADLSVAIGSEWMELRPIDEEDSTITCGEDAATPHVELGPTLAAAMEGRS